MQTVQFPLPKAGIDQLSNETSLKKGTWRTAENVDIDRSGQVGVRQGYVKAVNTTDIHSVYFAYQRSWLLACVGTTLSKVNTTDNSLTSLIDTGSNSPTSATEYNGNLYVVNRGGLFWSPANESAVYRCGTSAPTSPTVTATNLGGLVAGKYIVAISTVDARGEESPLSPYQRVELLTDGGIQLTDLPIVADGHVFIYVTPTNGDVLYLYASPPATLSSHLISATPAGTMSSTEYLTPFPGGEFVRWHNGRLYVASGDTLYYSDAFRPHLTRLYHNFVQFSGTISFVEAVLGGVYVGDDRGVWFLDGGDPTKFVLKRVSGCLAVRGSSTMVPSEHFDPKVVQTNLPVAVWLSTSGYTVGMASGEVVELNYDTIRVPSGLAGSTAFSIRQGRKQLTTLTSARVTPAGLAEDSTT